MMPSETEMYIKASLRGLRPSRLRMLLAARVAYAYPRHGEETHTYESLACTHARTYIHM